MEAAGLAVGVLSVASLCSACLQAFNLIGTAQEANIDYELLSIKLDIEKTRLLQWAEGVELLSHDSGDHNTTLLSPSIQPQLERILKAVKLLLTKSDDLVSIYGLTWDICDTQTQALAVSSRRNREFEAAFNHLEARSHTGMRRKKIGSTTRWAIKDREKFVQLLNNVHDLIDGLYDLAVVPKTFQRLMIKEDVEHLGNDLSVLRKLQIASLGQRNEWSECTSSQVVASQMASQDHRTVDKWLQDVDTQPGGGGGSLQTSGSIGVPKWADELVYVERDSTYNRFQHEPARLKDATDKRFSYSSNPAPPNPVQTVDQNVTSDGFGETNTSQSLLTDDSTVGSIRSFDSSSTIRDIPRYSMKQCVGLLSLVAYETEIRSLSRTEMLQFLGLLECIVTFHTGAARSILPMLGPNHLRKGRRTVLLQQIHALKRQTPYYNEKVYTDPSLFDKSSDPMKYTISLEGGRSFTVTRSFRRMNQVPSIGEIGMKRVLWTVVYQPSTARAVSHSWLLEHHGGDWIVRTLPSRYADDASLSTAGRSFLGFLTV